MNVLEEYAKVDLAKQMLKAQKHREELASAKSVEQFNSLKHQWGEEEPNSQKEEDHSSEDKDTDKYADDTDILDRTLTLRDRLLFGISGFEKLLQNICRI